MVSHHGFQRVYDLPENIIPAGGIHQHLIVGILFLSHPEYHAQGIASRNELFSSSPY
jgi:uncharacterized protein YcaQ